MAIPETRVPCYSRRTPGSRRHAGGRPRRYGGDVTMTDLQQQALDFLFIMRLDNVDHGQDHDAAGGLGRRAKTRSQTAGRCNFEWTRWRQVHVGARRPRSRYPEQSFPKKATFTRRGASRKKSFCGSIDSDKGRACTSTSASSADANVPRRSKPLIGFALRDAQQFHFRDKSYIKQTLGLQVAGYGRVAPIRDATMPGCS